MRLHTIGRVTMLACALLVAPLATDAQQPTKAARIGVLRDRRPSPEPSPAFEAFLHGLHEFGWVEGQNLIIERRYAQGEVEQLSDLAAELVRLNVDVILTSSTPATRAAKQATSTIPIVMAGGIGVDPGEAGFVASLARPEGNVTGMTTVGVELYEKRLELLQEAVSKLSLLAVLWNPGNPGNALCVREVKAVALAMGVKLQPLEVRDANAFEHAFAEIATETPDALIPCADFLCSVHARPIADFAVRSRLPTMTPDRGYVQAGGLMSYGTSIPGQLRRAAYYVDKILKGTKPADLPVERPMQFDLVINLKTAQALGLTLPPTLRFQANEVIQ